MARDRWVHLKVQEHHTWSWLQPSGPEYHATIPTGTIPKHWPESPQGYCHCYLQSDEAESNQCHGITVHYQCTVQMTTGKCSPMFKLPEHLAGTRTMCPEPHKLTATTTGVWTDPLQLYHCTKVLEQPTHPNGPWQNAGPIRELEGMRKGAGQGKCCQNRWHSSPESHTGCVLQLWTTRTLCSQLPL